MINLPIGTILTVPKTYNTPDGWMDYIEYLSLYDQSSELAEAIGLHYLESLHPVQAGAIKLSLGGEDTGSWVEWTKVGHLNQYPELKCRLQHIVSLMPNGETRKTWEQSLEFGYLPDISTMFFCANKEAGHFHQGNSGGMYIYPVIEHSENMLRPLGQTVNEEPKALYSPVEADKVSKSKLPANFVLLGQDASLHRLREVPTMFQIGNGGVGFPPHMTVQVLINTYTYIPSVPHTHKLIIKHKE